MTEQEKKDILDMLRNLKCLSCKFKEDYEKCPCLSMDTMYCKKLAEKLDREIVPYG